MANKIVREIIHAKGIDIGIYTKDFENEYISLTDIAKYRNDNDPRFVIQNWMRNRNTVEFLAVWEELHNPDFNRVQFEAVRSEAGLNRFVMTPTKWIEQTNAIGIVSKAGRYGGGTYAHSDIAMAFATWISPEIQLYIMKDYRRLKQDENSRFSLDWNLNRALSKVNYRIHTDAVKENLIPPELTPEQIDYTAGCTYLKGEELHLTPIEYKLLCILSRNVGKVLTHTYITQQIWGRCSDNDVASLRVFMATLRKKLESEKNGVEHIQTHVGIGYRMLRMEKDNISYIADLSDNRAQEPYKNE